MKANSIRRETPTPAQTESSCICIRLRRASRAITHLYDDALNASGLNIAQFSLLSTTSKLEPIAFGDLAAANKLDRSTLGRNIRVLERKELVEIEPGDDERIRIVRTTALGAKQLKSAVRFWDVAQDDVAKAITPAELTRLLRTLTKLEALAAQAE